MSNHSDNSSAWQAPPPGFYPESAVIPGPSSVVSTSVEVSTEVKQALEATKKVGCTLSGVPSFAVSKTDWKKLEDKLLSVQKDKATTVPTSELIKLQRELSELRLKANDFEDQNERLQYAERHLNKALENAEQNLAAAKDQARSAIAELDKISTQYKTQLKQAQAEKKEFQKAHQIAVQQGMSDDAEKLKTDKHRLSLEVTNLNNSLQQVNADKKQQSAIVKRFETQLVELTNELNLERTKHSITSGAKGTSFAERAKAMGSASVKLYNIAHTNLSKLALSRFEKIKDNPTEDRKNTAFWLKATFDATQHAVYKPYKVVFSGVVDDLKDMSTSSRRYFDPLLLAVRDSLLPTGRPLSLDELNSYLNDIPIHQIYLSSEYRAKGYKTLGQLIDSGENLGCTPPRDLPYRMTNGKLSFKGKEPILREVDPKPISPTLSEQAVFEEDPLNADLPPLPPSEDGSESDDGSGDPEDDPVSYYVRVRQWLHSCFNDINDRVRNSLRRRPGRLTRYYKLANGNWFKQACLIPYSWYIWAFP